MKSKTVPTTAPKQRVKKAPGPPRRANPPRDARPIRPNAAPDPEHYPTITDPTEISQPVMDLVHGNLKRAYAITKDHPMCLIFDRINPARLFKRGTVYSSKGRFIQWTPEDLAEATETDEIDDTGHANLMPFDPKPYAYVNQTSHPYSFR
jgi:hypothetical protein